jgi:hypothetical protein
LPCEHGWFKDEEAKMRVARYALVAVLAMCLAAPAFAANTRRTGTAGAQELRIPVSARGVALGDGYIADVGGVEAIYYNPAGMANVGGIEAYFSHLEYIADMDKNYIAAVTKTRFGTIGVSVDVLSIGDIEETTEEQPEGTGRIFSPNFSVVGLSYSRFLTDAVSVGGTAKYISERILEESASGLAFDIGVQYRPGWRSLRFGFLLKNFGPDMKFDGDDFESFHQTGDNPQSSPRALGTESSPFELPSVFQLGVAYTFHETGQNRVDGFGNFVSQNFEADQWQFGAEYNYGETFALRAGFLATDDEDFLYANSFSFGAGVGIPLSADTNLKIDYALRTVDSYFEDNQILSLKFIF